MPLILNIFRWTICAVRWTGRVTPRRNFIKLWKGSETMSYGNGRLPPDFGGEVQQSLFETRVYKSAGVEQNPNHFRCGEYVIHASFMEEEPHLGECLKTLEL